MNQQEEIEEIGRALAFFVENPKRRCIAGLSCYYSVQQLKEKNPHKELDITDDAKGCMVGYFLTPEEAYKWDQDSNIEEVGNIFDMKQDGRLPNNMTPNGSKVPDIILNHMDIMENLQVLHDDAGKWTDTGLSEEGKKFYP